MGRAFAMGSKLQQAKGKIILGELQECEEEKVVEEVSISPVDEEAEEVAEEEVVLPQYGYLRWIFFESPRRFCHDTFYGYPDSLRWVEFGYEHSTQKFKIALYLSSPFSYRVVAKPNQAFLREEWKVRRWQKETGGYEAYRRDSVEEGVYWMMFTAVATLYATFCLFMIWGVALFLFPAPADKALPTEPQGDAFSFSEELKNLFREGDVKENPAMNAFIKRLRIAACLFDNDKDLHNKEEVKIVPSATGQFEASSAIQNNVAFLKKADRLLSESREENPSLCRDKVHRHFLASNAEGCQTLIKAILKPELCPHLIELLFKNSALLQESIRSVLRNGVHGPLLDASEENEEKKQDDAKKDLWDINAAVDDATGALTSMPKAIWSIFKELLKAFSNLKKLILAILYKR